MPAALEAAVEAFPLPPPSSLSPETDLEQEAAQVAGLFNTPFMQQLLATASPPSGSCNLMIKVLISSNGGAATYSDRSSNQNVMEAYHQVHIASRAASPAKPVGFAAALPALSQYGSNGGIGQFCTPTASGVVFVTAKTFDLRDCCLGIMQVVHTKILDL